MLQLGMRLSYNCKACKHFLKNVYTIYTNIAASNKAKMRAITSFNLWSRYDLHVVKQDGVLCKL